MNYKVGDEVMLSDDFYNKYKHINWVWLCKNKIMTIIKISKTYCDVDFNGYTLYFEHIKPANKWHNYNLKNEGG